MNDIDLLQTQVQINQRRSVFLSLHNLCVFADKQDYIEVTEWTNGEGYDVEIYRQKDRSECTFKLTYGEAATLMTLLNKLD